MVGNFSAEDACACIYGTVSWWMGARKAEIATHCSCGVGGISLCLRNTVSSWEARKRGTWPVSSVLPTALKRQFLLPFSVAIPPGGQVALLDEWPHEGWGPQRCPSFFKSSILTWPCSAAAHCMWPQLCYHLRQKSSITPTLSPFPITIALDCSTLLDLHTGSVLTEDWFL